VCEFYTTVKNDYIYRGDVIESVPFVRVDPPLYLKADHQDTTRPAYIREGKHARGSSGDGIVCQASSQRMMGVVIDRTCEANRPGKKPRVPPFVRVAPIRRLNEFPPEFVEGLAHGFPADDPDEPPGQCYRFMLLPPCADHAMPDGGVICFREATPIHVGFIVGAKRATRLSQDAVHAMVERMLIYDAQSKEDDIGDAAVESEPSKIVKKWTDIQMRSESHETAAAADLAT
jgi:hypothetical protein